MHELVVLSLEPWDDVWRRNQYLTDGLLKRDPELHVLFVEPSNDMLHSLVSGRGVRRGAGLRTAPGYGGRLHLYQPNKLLPRVVGPLADALLRSAVSGAWRSLGMRAPVLWVNDPSWATLVSKSGCTALYDMTDDWLAAKRPARELKRIAENEATLMRECAAVVVCSEGLRASRQAQRDVVLIPNAVDVDRYRASTARPADLPDTSAVYVGTLHEDRLDIGLVLSTADAAASAGGKLVFVGPVALTAENRERLERHDAIVLLGPRAFTEVPAYLQHAAVLVVPHSVDNFTDSLDPLKLYEYLAVGRPIVSTPVAGFRDLHEAQLTVAEGDEYAAAVAERMRSPHPTEHRAEVPRWSDRVTAYERVLTPLRQPQ